MTDSENKQEKRFRVKFRDGTQTHVTAHAIQEPMGEHKYLIFLMDGKRVAQFHEDELRGWIEMR